MHFCFFCPRWSNDSIDFNIQAHCSQQWFQPEKCFKQKHAEFIDKIGSYSAKNGFIFGIVSYKLREFVCRFCEAILKIKRWLTCARAYWLAFLSFFFFSYSIWIATANDANQLYCQRILPMFIQHVTYVKHLHCFCEFGSHIKMCMRRIQMFTHPASEFVNRIHTIKSSSIASYLIWTAQINAVMNFPIIQIIRSHPHTRATLDITAVLWREMAKCFFFFCQIYILWKYSLLYLVHANAWFDFFRLSLSKHASL